MNDWMKKYAPPIIICVVAALALWGFWPTIKAWWTPSPAPSTVVAAKPDIPFERVLTVVERYRVKAKDPRCGNWRSDESYIKLYCEEDPPPDHNPLLDNPKTKSYHLKVTMERRHKDIRKDFIEFNQMAENLAPGVQVRIEANPKTKRRGLEPGMRLPKRYPSPVYIEKSGDMDLIVVPQTRLSILDID